MASSILIEYEQFSNRSIYQMMALPFQNSGSGNKGNKKEVLHTH